MHVKHKPPQLLHKKEKYPLIHYTLINDLSITALYKNIVWKKIKTKTKTGFSLRSFILNFALYYDLTFSACWMSFSPSSVSCWLYAEISELRRVSSNCLNARAIKLKSMSASFRSISESADLCARRQKRQKKISNLQVFINLEFFEICRLYF